MSPDSNKRPTRRGHLREPFAPHVPPRSLSQGRAPFPGHSQLTGRPHLDAPPIGRPKLAQPLYYVVKLRDGRPGVVAAADHTKVWVAPHNPHLRTLPQPPGWWDWLMNALEPKAGFVLYSDDHDKKALGDPAQFVRKGIVYDAIDVTQLKKAMDMSMDAWTKPSLKTREVEKLINWVLRFSKNAGAAYGKGKDTYEAAGAVQEALTATPEVKAVVYSQHKTSMAQVDSAYNKQVNTNVTSLGGGFERERRGNVYDSAYVISKYQGTKKVGQLTVRPRR